MSLKVRLENSECTINVEEVLLKNAAISPSGKKYLLY